MTRPTRIHIDTGALTHNLNVVKNCAPKSQVIAMVKANAYGSGLTAVVPILDEQIHAFGVACLEEAMAIHALGAKTTCLLFQGVYSAAELHTVANYDYQCVIHQACQLEWLLTTALSKKITVWVKVNTGMHRLGFAPNEVYAVMNALMHCPWVNKKIGLITHLARSDEPSHKANQTQLQQYNQLILPKQQFIRTVANSAAILSLPETHFDMVRPGIMLYGISPFANKTAAKLNLKPVMHFISAITSIHHYPIGANIGYSGIWQTSRPSIIGVIPVGYGDGYPRHINPGTFVWINGNTAPIVGRISMDSLTVDLTDCLDVNIGTHVELWGSHIPVEIVASQAKTSPYELVCQVSPRVLR